jgi:hypothetical protein
LRAALAHWLLVARLLAEELARLVPVGWAEALCPEELVGWRRA